VGNRTLLIDRPFCAVLGATQPEILKYFAAGDKGGNGFFARLLFSYPENSTKQAYSKARPDPGHLERWSCIIRRLAAIPPQGEESEGMGDRRLSPWEIPLGKDAEVLYREYFDRNAAKINSEDDEIVQSILGKFDNYCLRIALILTLLHWAESGPDDPEIEDIMGLKVTGEAMRGAIRAIAYFEATALKVVNRLAGPVECLPEVQQVWYDALPEEFERREALELAKEAGISQRQMGRLLGREDLFKRVRQGAYWKLHIR